MTLLNCDYKIASKSIANRIKISCKRNCNLKLCPEKNFKWQKGNVEALGVWPSTDHQDGKCTFCRDENEDLTHLFWKCQKTNIFRDNFSIWLQSCQILPPGSYLDMTTALGLTPDSSSVKVHINFCCLIANTFIWIRRSRECFPIHNNFLFYLRHRYQLENNNRKKNNRKKNRKNGYLSFPR